MGNRLIYALLIILFSISCKRDQDKSQDNIPDQVALNAEKWSLMDGDDYPYRPSMVDDILYTDKIRKLQKEEIISLLGEPDREQDGHLYYKIMEKKMGPMTLTASFIVIKLNENGSVEWIKLHGGG